MCNFASVNHKWGFQFGAPPMYQIHGCRPVQMIAPVTRYALLLGVYLVSKGTQQDMYVALCCMICGREQAL